MTGRRIVIAAGAAMTVAVLALAARPLLHSSRPRAHIAVATALAVPAAVAPLAAQSARKAVRCRASSPPTRAGCGPLQIERTQSRCPDVTHCLVQIAGQLETSGLRVPVALTVTAVDTATGWRTVQVSS
jgi:hypothetical protein